jgi:CRP-like cAMP-binding protein
MIQAPNVTTLRAREPAGLEEQLRAIDFLAVLDAQALRSVAEHVQKRVYLPGELVVREGEPGEELFVIMEGEADVVIKTGDRTTPVATLTKGQFFGEMSLLTGAPRSATVQAKSPLTVTVIGKHAMSQVMSRNPGLAEKFATILAARQSGLAATRETADRAATMRLDEEDKRSLTRRILKFFRLAGN